MTFHEGGNKLAWTVVQIRMWKVGPTDPFGNLPKQTADVYILSPSSPLPSLSLGHFQFRGSIFVAAKNCVCLASKWGRTFANNRIGTKKRGLMFKTCIGSDICYAILKDLSFDSWLEKESERRFPKYLCITRECFKQMTFVGNCSSIRNFRRRSSSVIKRDVRLKLNDIIHFHLCKPITRQYF